MSEQSLLQIVTMLIPTLGGSLLGSLIGAYKTRSTVMKALQNGTKYDMKCHIREIHNKVCIERAGCTLQDKHDMQEVYDIYKALGGNGACTSLYNEVMRAEVTQ